MKIQVSENDEVLAFARIGDVENSVDLENSDIPENFETDFKPRYFLYKHGKIFINKNYVEPDNSIDRDSNLMSNIEIQTLIEDLTLQVLELQMSSNVKET